MEQNSIPRGLSSVCLYSLAIVVLALLLPACSDDPVSNDPASDGLEYVSPEDVGWSSSKLEQARQFASQSGFASVMVAYDGKVFFSWGQVNTGYRSHSIRKPFLSALYGIHLNRGEISLNATLEELGIDDTPPSLTPEEKQANVRELLQSRSGVYHEAAAESDTMIALRPPRGSHPHGTFYYYNNWDFNAAGTIFRQETGLDIFETFKSEIADQIGMEEFSVSSCYYQYEQNKSMHPAYHFRMSTRDMLRFGVLYQKNGKWLDKQIVQPAWITESTTAYSVLDSASGAGYGYMWKVIPPGSPFSQMFGSSGFFHTGHGGHALVILTDLKLVLVERVDTDVPGWVDPGDAGMELGLMIINARI
jgi:CubicO group peptidase (beta-lactamase class C family)